MSINQSVCVRRRKATLWKDEVLSLWNARRDLFVRLRKQASGIFASIEREKPHVFPFSL